MKGKMYILFFSLLIITGVSAFSATIPEVWESPFDTTVTDEKRLDSVLTLDDALQLVAAENPTLRALVFQKQAALGQLEQAGLWPNPEFSTEIEEVGWDAPGLKESEITVTLSQELELFGKRSARKQVARAEIDATSLRTKLSAFDLYLETKRRFYFLAYTQKQLDLSLTSVELAKSIVENITYRIGKGAALESELLLAKLEAQQTQLQLEESRQEVAAAQVSLAALWRGTTSDITVSINSEPQLSSVLDKIASLSTKVDSTRNVLQLYRQSEILRAEHSLAAAQARPSLIVSGGYKRIEANNSNSFVLGVSLPLPFFNRNQGSIQSIKARLRSLDYELQRSRLESDARIQEGIINLRRSIQRHTTLDSLLLPTATEAYHTLQSAYKTGRIPYTQLLEAERTLNRLRFEHNDMLLEIHYQIIDLESITGLTLRIDKEIE